MHTDPERVSVQTLADAPEGFVVSWYTDFMARGYNWDFATVAVWCGERVLCTLGAPWDPDPDLDIYLQPDVACLLQVIDDGSEAPAAFLAWPLDAGQFCIHHPIACTAQAVARFADVSTYWTGAPAWTAAALNQAIEDWCLGQTGRVIEACFDAEHGPSPLGQMYLDLARSVDEAMETSSWN